MRHELIQQTQEMAATATAALDSILALRAQLFNNIDAAQQNPSQADHLVELEKRLSDIDMAIGQVRIYLLGLHRTLVSAQTLAQANIKIPHQLAKEGKPWIVVVPKIQ